MEKKEFMSGIVSALYQIHSMADVLGLIIAEQPNSVNSISGLNGLSCPFISFTDMIMEKAAFCLKVIEDDEEGGRHEQKRKF